MKSQVPRAAAATLCALVFWVVRGTVATAAAEDARQEHGAAFEFGIARSNIGTQWTLAWPQEPNVSPFLAAE